MKNEETRIAESKYFEGIVSLRVLISNMENYKNGNFLSDRKIISVFVSDSRKEKNESEFKWLEARSKGLGFGLEVLPQDDINNMAGGTTHGGIIALCGERSIPELDVETVKKSRFSVMLDGIEDPFNFGYCLRSLYAAGCDCIILPERNWMSVAGIVAKSSAGASEMIPMYISSSLSAVSMYSDMKVKIVAADLRDSVSLYDADLTLPLLMVVGGEKRGISRAVLDMADTRIRIDYGREFSASLSAASAATIVGFEVFRQNRK